MSENNGNSGDKGKTIGTRGGGTETSRVRQSFSHGRSKTVVVEKKRKRVVAPKPGSAATGGVQSERVRAAQGSAAKGLGDSEMERRRKALMAAKANEAERIAREKEAEERRKAEMDRLRAEKDEAARAEAEEAARLKAEAEAKAMQEAEEAKRKADEEARQKARPRGAKKEDTALSPADVPAPPNENEGPRRSAPGGAPKRDDRRNERENKKSGGGDKRRSGKLTINQAMGEGGRQKSLAAMRRRQERQARKGGGGGSNEPREKVVRDVKVPEAITVAELANRMAERVADVVKSLMQNGIMATQNQTIDADTAELLVEEFGHKVVRVSDADVEDVIAQVEDKAEDLSPRAPVITIMGHVDHGKTSLLDAIRKTNVVSGEAGGITQHIGAYQINTEDGAKLTFLDTPGHAAFTSMRARGAQVTDIVILVVAADDSVMPQTIEAINHAKAAKVPMIVAINKIDRPGADPQKVRTQLLQHEVVVEAMSGDVLDVEVSAVNGTGLDTLVENIALQAELLELKANADREASGAVIEAQLDVGRGPVATVLVQNGTLKRGDIFVVGEQWGKVRALINDQGERVNEAGPSVPVEVLGLNGTPEAGDVLNVVPDEARAREISSYRQQLAKDKRAAAGAATTLDQLLAKAKADENVAELPIVVKADVQGSAEAIVQAMEKIGNDEVRVRVLHSGVGAITESDVTLAEASGAPIIGFNVRANAPARESANQKGLEIRYYSIIYDLVDDVKQAASGLLSAEVRENFIGYASIKEVFKVSNVGKVAGCVITEGVARRSAGVRLLRDNVVIHEGTLKTLKRFKDEVKEVQGGQECGMAFENYEDIREGDVIEIFETEEIERNL
ncbi:translation initiation factor IF-2 [Pontivivens insulae]|uniref:Translation initiation factor IF-2 n=1 Tax=Pontivivens insulae TaxID=1639689 RepID=A0A2R8AEU9_9RHOB|nr:translation initiation factor IF-2 [Pontivivens insulae]RED12027.1 translation initiation factor 2 (bIF-2) [Pontivivens insulae]SPF30783.1 Translation initiation factor IF-2 [Pontivivens insulae]